MQEVYRFIRESSFAAMPEAVRNMALRCVLDLAGTAAAGRATDLSRIICNHAVRSFNAGTARRARGFCTTGALPARRAPPWRAA